MNEKTKIILRNESFGGVYFNQANGRMVMVDAQGFNTLLKTLGKKRLNEKEKKFSNFFFNSKFPKEVELRIDPTIKYSNSYSVPITKTPVLIDLSLNNYCNLNCDYCYMSATSIQEGTDLSMEDVESLLSKMIKSRVLQIALGGGEPTLHPNFPLILKKLRVDANVVPNYTTNGTNLTNEILEASKQYCGAVAVSYSEERFDETIDATKKLISQGIQTNMHLVLLKSIIPRLSEITEQYAKIGISNVVLLLFKPMGRGINLTHEILDSTDRKMISLELLKILALRKKYGVRLSIDACSSFIVKDFPFLPQSIEGCTGSTYSAYIDWDLNMKPCSFMQNDRGFNLKQQSILSAWESDLFENFRKKLISPRYEGCKACDHFLSCLSGCPISPDIVFCEEKGDKIDESYVYEEG
jgi:radical SAM protein with 4Fe4S-binding SPASM domain